MAVFSYKVQASELHILSHLDCTAIRGVTKGPLFVNNAKRLKMSLFRLLVWKTCWLERDIVLSATHTECNGMYLCLYSLMDALRNHVYSFLSCNLFVLYIVMYECILCVAMRARAHKGSQIMYVLKICQMTYSAQMR